MNITYYWVSLHQLNNCIIVTDTTNYYEYNCEFKYAKIGLSNKWKI